ncbi:MAG TPA: PEP-CTERM sorting domain-containing protein [Tepidisphaeraceae bacterium]|nr:PEP-CTERM sorting domain-containing protein [Tepidisphaeraceae bacterium]
MRGFSGFKAAFVGSAALLFSAASLYAQPVPPVPPQPTNGLTVIPRFFNDFPNSTQTYSINGGPTITNPPANVGIPVAGAVNSVTVNDTNMVNSPASGFVNRDDLMLSTDAGATPFVGSINTPFFQTATINLTDLTDTQRKEAGIRVKAPVTGDAVFEINTTGEIVAFGGGAPFFNFRPNIEAAYIPGQTITLSEQYTPGVGGTTNGNPGTMQYWAQLSGGPLLTSGPLAWSNLEGGPGPNSFNIGAFVQAPDGSGASPSDFVNAAFTNISGAVPEPASLGTIGFGALMLLGRRRQRVA